MTQSARVGPNERQHLLVVFQPADDLMAGLEREGIVARIAPTLAIAVQEVLSAPPAAVLILAQDETAVETCQVLRALGDFPIIVAPRPLASTIVANCLDTGADIAFGYSPPPVELATRLEALIHRGGTAGHEVHVGDLVIDLRERSVTRAGRRLDLTPTEFRLLSVLAEHVGHVVATQDLLKLVWGEDYLDDVQYVRLYIGYLRAKIETDPSSPRYIITQRSIGYRLQDPPLETDGR